jgi:phosphopantothenoylcysteine decarboxylase/phosphopantothenate--cysteine ligase
MGYALAAEAARRGAEVTVIAANVALSDPPGVRVHRVATAAELEAAAREAFPACDVLLMAAAVADFRPAAPQAAKIKKDAGPPELALEPTTDVLSTLAAERRAGQTLVGFAAEHGEGAVAYGRGKLERKRLDAVVVNDVGAPGIGFESGENAVTIVTAAGDREVGRRPKAQIAAAVLDAVDELRAQAGGSKIIDGGGTARSAAGRSSRA